MKSDKILITIFEIFKNVINYLSQTKTMTIHKIWNIYDDLFNHLKKKKRVKSIEHYKLLICKSLSKLNELN